MERRILSAVGVLALFTFAVAAQKFEPPKLEPTPSTESQTQLIKKGVALHDKADFAGAISRYEEVLKENPNNVLALYEMSYSYYARKDYQKSLDIGLKAVRYKSDLLELSYVQIGSCFDEMGDSKKAVEAYRFGLKLSPESSLLHYNLAVTYSRAGQLEDAKAAAKKAAVLDPNHRSSQLLLSTLFDKGSYKTPALLAACRFLILEPTSNRSDVALRLVQKIMQAGVSPGKSANEINIFVDTSTQKKDEGDFSSIDTFMGLAKAADYTEENKGKSEMQLLVGNFDSLLAFLAESKADRSKFTWKYYAPYFLEMKKQGHLEACVYYINQRSTIVSVNEWLKQNQNKVADFLAWSKGYSWPKMD